MAYSAKFREKMVQRMAGPHGRAATSMAQESGVARITLSRWLARAMLDPMADNKKRKSERQRKRWTPEEMMRVVMESAGSDDDARGALLRREGLHDADLERFRQEMLDAAREGFAARKKPRGATVEQMRVKTLEKELRRKDKALAETAALLVLGKKVDALFRSEEEEESTDENNG